MLKTIKGVYNNGSIELLEVPKDIRTQMDVFITFFMQSTAANGESLSSTQTDPRQRIIAQLSILLDKIQLSGFGQDEHVALFEQFSDIANKQLLNVFEHATRNHLRLVVLLKTVLRRLKQTKLSEQHIELLQQLLNLLTNELIQSTEIMALHKQFRAAGIETMMRMDKRYPALVELYEQDNAI
ncbi:MAG: hypothetical protein AAF639_41605 [Chloroflexota bacterium]